MKKITLFITAIVMVVLCMLNFTSCGENYPVATDFQVQWGIKQIGSNYVTGEANKGYATVKYSNEKYKSIMVYELIFIATDEFDRDTLAEFLVKHYSDTFETKQDALDELNASDIRLDLSMSGNVSPQMTNGGEAYFDVRFNIGSKYYDLYEYANTYSELENFKFESYDIAYIESSANLIYIEYNAITGEYTVED